MKCKPAFSKEDYVSEAQRIENKKSKNSSPLGYIYCCNTH